MTQDAQFDEMTTRWAEADYHARVYCTYLLGAQPPHAEGDLLALAHQALIDEEDPGELLTQHTRVAALR